MSYDWNDKVQQGKYSREWFDEIDRRFIFGARLFGHDKSPFDKLIPFSLLAGKSVLEIGCGMGLHAELIARAGAKLTAIDLSPTSVESTQRRLALKALPADVRQMDACTLEFPDGSFDFVWSWGVIHHSARTGTIIKEIHRVLKPGGTAKVMVYNLNGMWAYATIARDYLFAFWRGQSLDKCLWNRSDGYTARFYTADILTDIFHIFFPKVDAFACGQDADAVPLPSPLRKIALRWLSPSWVKEAGNKRGAFLVVEATKEATPR